MIEGMDIRTEYLVERSEIIAGIGVNCGIPPRELDDFVQEVFVRSLSTRCDFDPRISSLKTYAGNLVKMVAKNWLKSNNIGRNVECENNAVEAMSVDRDGTEKSLEETLEQIQNTIQSQGYVLTWRQKQVLIMLQNGMRQAEIARILGISRAAVFYRLKYVRKKYKGTIKSSGTKKRKR